MSRPTILAAGGVLWRGSATDPEVALVHRPRYDDESLPKGKAKPGEHLLVTAVREMTEETGYAPRIGPYLGTVRYRVSSRGGSANKAVSYWSMRCLGGEFRASREVDRMDWVSLHAARSRVTSASDRAVLDAFAQTRRDTEPLLLVRHGETTSPARRLKSSSASQRLNRSGRDQAAALVPVLEGLGVTDLISADLPSCVDMLAPFAAATGLTVRREGLLTRAGFAGNEQEVADGVRRQAAISEALVVCGEQPVITGLLTALGRGSQTPPPRETAVSKGGWWLLHHYEGAITAYERHDPAA
ncbi:MAG: 8-oxo-(d)GTP phosphatase [Actinomycetota bacterium]|nr:8-oxo-(d)GTP phosphatase [Actinomycetota bacterium]